ncbi:MAG: DUF512 domain-containing protein [Candidatus Delongbacteria bacterium]|nr:DUF512 domain-containing protein [Candidatus Delongbacteria bacterium]MCG2760652.1 DUF512 domain-containing protein [Candidatus Delongbacteria bacterium]
MVKITHVEKGSAADRSGIKKGDNLITVNGNIIDDAIDFNYYCADDPLNLILNGKMGTCQITLDAGGSNGIEVEGLKIRHCGNKCIFCFIDQNPKGMRKTIYVKDEDYRYSFLYGNYFTLTNISQKDMNKIVSMKLSPLYISVHAINNEARKKLLGIKKDDELLQKIKYLTDNGIELHAQVVLCPEINDGRLLKETIETLRKFYPKIRSVAVVPVGLTKHRNNLPEIKPVEKKCALETLKIISEFNKKYNKEIGTNFVFGADEFYIKAKLEFPDEDYYGDYLQYENGVGMARDFIERFNETIKYIPKRIRKRTAIILVTGELFFPIMAKMVVPLLNNVKNLDISLIKARNTLFGNSVTVAGLLGGNDIINAVGVAKSSNEILMIPSTCLNYDGKFLDDLTIEDLIKKTGFRVILIENPVEIFENI